MDLTQDSAEWASRNPRQLEQESALAVQEIKQTRDRLVKNDEVT